MITNYSFPNSRSLRVTWTLEELGLEYLCQHVALDSGEGQTAEHLARHPDGKVPVIEKTGELTLFESAPICRYLAEQYGDGRLLPESAAERAQVDQWLSFIVTEIEQPLWLQAKHKFALPQDQRVPSVLPTAAWEFQRALACTRTPLPGPGDVSRRDVHPGRYLPYPYVNVGSQYETPTA